jgi:hypothetical protein
MKSYKKYNIKFALSIAKWNNLFLYEDNLYEKLFDHPYQEQYRVFIDNDYDYVEDQELTKELNNYLTKYEWWFGNMNNN